MFYDRIVRSQILLTNSNYSGFRGEINISDLRMSFSINKTRAAAVNTCQFRIYNLSADNRNRLREFGDELRVFAGYRENGGDQLLFIGNVNDLRHDFAQPDIITAMGCGDGERTLNNTLIATSFSGRTPVRTVIEYIANRLALPLVFFAQTPDIPYENGFSEAGLAKDVLKIACDRLSLTYSVQNGNLVIIENNGSTTKPPVEINLNTGMIGIPQRFVDKKQFLYRALTPNAPPKAAWKVRTLLRPDLLPGDRIRLRSTQVDIDAILTIDTISHIGDTHGPVFESSIEAYPL